MPTFDTLGRLSLAAAAALIFSHCTSDDGADAPADTASDTSAPADTAVGADTSAAADTGAVADTATAADTSAPADTVTPAGNPDSVGYGARKTVTIDGANTADEWGDDTLLIRDPAADDARFLGANWTGHEPPWDYAFALIGTP